MSDQGQSGAMCQFVLAYILKSIADSGGIPKEARDAAKKTLLTDAESRKQRAEALKNGHEPTCADDSKTSIFGRAATATAAGLTLKRYIYDGKNRSKLPGFPSRKEGDPRSLDRQVDNAYDAVGVTSQFYSVVFGRNAITGDGKTRIVTVHYDDDPRDPGHNNAFWDGTQFVFGDGDGIIFDYSTDSLDVAAHELTHAVTDYTLRLSPDFTQSGALHESISDVFAAMTEQWFLDQTVEEADWLTGQSLFSVATKGAALRNIAEPGTAFNDPQLGGKDGGIAHCKDFNDKLDVHDAVGISTRAFYLISVGFEKEKKSFDTAGKIWYATLNDKRLYERQGGVTFKQWAEVTLDHANRLFGDRGSTIVRDSWASVGITVSLPQSLIEAKWGGLICWIISFILLN